jgi:hypothetical protein
LVLTNLPVIMFADAIMRAVYRVRDWWELERRDNTAQPRAWASPRPAEVRAESPW